MVHIVGALLLAGGALTATALGVYASAGTSTHSIRFAADLQTKADRFMITPGAVIAIIFGVLLVLDSDIIEFSDAWISAAFVLWFIAGGLGSGVLTPHAKRVRDQADRLIGQGVADSAELQAQFGSPRAKAIGVALNLLLIVFVYLMVAKPGA
jgi:uncharacterized membrane protein